MIDPDADPVYGDVQGTILRGYRTDLARHFVLGVVDAAAARRLIGALVDGRDGLPRITTAERWRPEEKPECFLNVGFTAAGLRQLGVTDKQLQTFDRAFQLGATHVKSAGAVGDVGESAPSHWIGGLADGSQVHVLVSLWVDDKPVVLEEVTARLRAAFAGALRELSAHDAKALPDNQVHFGYRDSIAQPRVKGAPPRKPKHDVPDAQPEVPTGEFLLGYTRAGGGTYRVDPQELSDNSSYAAFRILEQDSAGFEAFLVEYAAKAKIDVELLAAKVCGRWRNGNPLELVPDAPAPVLPNELLNDFTYLSDEAAKDDTLGVRCPIGSHIRRNNPRDEKITGTDSVHHRIVRRAMPYGPPYDPAHPDTVPRGLVGYFINASLFNQFEFITSLWNLGHQFVISVPERPGCPGKVTFSISGEDVFLGVNDPKNSSFTLAACGSRQKLTGFSRFVTTRGGAYVFLPSITGLRYLSGLTPPG